MYAPDDFAAAEASLKRYDGFVAQRDYKQALSTALDVRDRAYEAAKTATAKQTALRAEADQRLNALFTDIVSVDAKLKVARPRTQAKQVAKLRQTRKTAAVAMQEARTQVTAGELTPAIKRLVDVSAALKRDSDALDGGATKAKK